MASSGYTAITFVANEQPTTAKWNLIGSNDSSFNLGTGLEDNVIINRHIADSTVGYPELAANATYLGYDDDAGTILTNAYVTRTSVAATSRGGRVIIDVGGFITNGNSGAYRSTDIKLLCDGALVKEITGLGNSFSSSNNPTTNFNYKFSHTPAAGAHTWELQMKASISSAVVLGENYMEVKEVK